MKRDVFIQETNVLIVTKERKTKRSKKCSSVVLQNSLKSNNESLRAAIGLKISTRRDKTGVFYI